MLRFIPVKPIEDARGLARRALARAREKLVRVLSDVGEVAQTSGGLDIVVPADHPIEEEVTAAMSESVKDDDEPSMVVDQSGSVRPDRPPVEL